MLSAMTQDEHGEAEQVQVGEEAVVARVLLHVLGGVQVDEEADAGDHQHHHGAHGVDAEGHVDGHVWPGAAPVMENQRHAVQVSRAACSCPRRRVREEREEGGDARHERAADGGERHQAHALLAEPLAEDAVDEGAERGERQDDRQQREVRRGEL